MPADRFQMPPPRGSLCPGVPDGHGGKDRLEGHMLRGCVIWAFVAVMIAVLATLAILDLSNDPEPRASSVPLPHRPADNPCPSEPDDKPRRSKYTNQADPYEGPAPHPVKVVNKTGFSRPNAPRRALPDGWEATNNTLDTQLIVCEYLVSTGAVVDACEYIGNSFVPLVSATWTYRVLAARTTQQVTQFTLKGTDTCPFDITYLEGDYPSETPQSVRTEDLKKALLPLVAP
ncbi:hypothetical protein [Streptomyces sp. NPDC046979]|uniref:hypothetical protein n=1 Tax=Streptomyces sp. NPDC046979 TaxID=3154604 RepID=UPI0033E59716